MIDERRLFVMVGDVSGKGVPASLFMALGKALYKSCVLRGERDIGTVMAAANAEISRDNVEGMFVTAFAAILDLETGELAFANAGHDAPFLLIPPGAPARPGQRGRPADRCDARFRYLGRALPAAAGRAAGADHRRRHRRDEPGRRFSAAPPPRRRSPRFPPARGPAEALAALRAAPPTLLPAPSLTT